MQWDWLSKRLAKNDLLPNIMKRSIISPRLAISWLTVLPSSLKCAFPGGHNFPNLKLNMNNEKKKNWMDFTMSEAEMWQHCRPGNTLRIRFELLCPVDWRDKLMISYHGCMRTGVYVDIRINSTLNSFCEEPAGRRGCLSHAADQLRELKFQE